MFYLPLSDIYQYENALKSDEETSTYDVTKSRVIRQVRYGSLSLSSMGSYTSPIVLPLC